MCYLCWLYIIFLFRFFASKYSIYLPLFIEKVFNMYKMISMFSESLKWFVQQYLNY